MLFSVLPTFFYHDSVIPEDIKRHSIPIGDKVDCQSRSRRHSFFQATVYSVPYYGVISALFVVYGQSIYKHHRL